MASSTATPATMAMRRVVIPISFIARDGQSAGRRCPAAPSGANRAPVNMPYRDKRVPTASHGAAVSIHAGSRQGPVAATADRQRGEYGKRVSVSVDIRDRRDLKTKKTRRTRYQT